MTKSLFVACGLMFNLVAIPTTYAQVTLDVSKITCNQFAFQKITSSENIAIWINGYYNGKRGNTIVDTQSLRDDAKKLLDYCFQYPKVTVMQAVETLFGTTK